jgi:hypothetical protein
MIELHDQSGDLVMVNPIHIVQAYAGRTYTMIQLTSVETRGDLDSCWLQVQESLGTIKTAIANG